jgi:molybdenum cofactor cytidylyltransferase
MRGIGGLVLAAGGSSRLGQPKQLLELRGETLVHSAVRAAQEGGCDVVCVVTGHAQEAVEEAVADLHPLLVHNADWQRGIGSSIRVGLEAVQPVSAVLLLPCDQPALDATILRSLIEGRYETRRPIVASHYSGTIGIPALFDISCFGELRKLRDECGAKQVIEADPARVTSLKFAAGALDLDSPDDLRAWLALCHKSATGGAQSQELLEARGFDSHDLFRFESK